MANKSKEALGRGLGELLGEVQEAYDNEVPKDAKIYEIDLDRISPNPYQPRKDFDPQALLELSNSIKENGLLQPIVVKEDVDGYIIIAGERRFRASKLAKLPAIKAIVVDATPDQMRRHALIENIQREDLNALELAQAYQELIDVHNITHEKLAELIHKSRAQITNTIRLLQLSDSCKEALRQEKITSGHARALLALDKDEQNSLLQSITGQKLSVRDAEKIIRNRKNGWSKKNNELVQQHDILDFSTAIECLKRLGIGASSKQNVLKIEFQNSNELERFLENFK